MVTIIKFDTYFTFNSLVISLLTFRVTYFLNIVPHITWCIRNLFYAPSQALPAKWGGKIAPHNEELEETLLPATGH
jgi:hypothetical protein